MHEHFAPSDKSSPAMFYRAHDQLAERDRAFMELATHPTNPLTNAGLKALIARRPERYSRYAGFIGKLAD